MNIKMSEIWKEFYIKNHLYRISNLGTIQTYIKDDNWYTMKTKINRKGYLVVMLCDRKNYSIHRLVAIHFIPNPNDLPQVNHKNGIKIDNVVDPDNLYGETTNLEWCTNRYNYEHAIETKLKNMKYASSCAIQKTSKKVMQLDFNNNIIKIWNSISEAERKLGISNSHISSCCRHKKGFKSAGGYHWEYYNN